MTVLLLSFAALTQTQLSLLQQQQSSKSLSSSSPQVGSILPLPNAVQQKQPMNNNKKILTATARGIPNQFIVVLKDSLDSTSANSNAPSTLSVPSPLIPNDNDGRLPESATKALREIAQRAISMGAKVPRIFDSVIHGFTAVVPNRQVIDALAKDPRVAYIEQDQRVKAFQTLPTGINRVDADLSPTHSGDGTGSVNADIAIIDTG